MTHQNPEYILIALVGALINFTLALIIPSILSTYFKNTKNSVLLNIKKVYESHKEVLITSSVIVFITVYLALLFTPSLDECFSSGSGSGLGYLAFISSRPDANDCFE